MQGKSKVHFFPICKKKSHKTMIGGTFFLVMQEHRHRKHALLYVGCLMKD